MLIYTRLASANPQFRPNLVTAHWNLVQLYTNRLEGSKALQHVQAVYRLEPHNQKALDWLKEAEPNIGTRAPVRLSRLAIASVALLLPTLVLGPLSSLPAVIVGFLAMRKINQSKGSLKGESLAMAGVIIGSLLTLLSLGLIVFYARYYARMSVLLQ